VFGWYGGVEWYKVVLEVKGGVWVVWQCREVFGRCMGGGRLSQDRQIYTTVDA
jgi:hypothetical protein